MARKKNKTLWVLLVAFLFAGSTLGYILLSKPGETQQPQGQTIPENLIVNFSLPQEMEAQILQSGFTILRISYTEECDCEDFIARVEELQEEFKTTGGYKQILLEELLVDKLNATGNVSETAPLIIEIKSLRSEAILDTMDEQALVTQLCNITWDPPIEYCFKIE